MPLEIIPAIAGLSLGNKQYAGGHVWRIAGFRKSKQTEPRPVLRNFGRVVQGKGRSEDGGRLGKGNGGMAGKRGGELRCKRRNHN